jgi:cytochrome P450
MVSTRVRGKVDVMTTTLACPNIFDATLPTIDYGNTLDPDAAHQAIREARMQAPIAFGPYGPELLDYELVRTMLRDSRFAMPKGIGLVVQGITSGPVWDRLGTLLIGVDAAQHQRLRRLVARAFTPRAADRMRAACVDVINELVDAVADAGQCDFVADVANHYPIPIICELLGAPRDDWQLFSGWATDISKAFGGNVAGNEPAILEAWDALDGYLEELIERRRHRLVDDLISDLIRIEDDGERLSHDEMRNLALMLLNAGTDTTRNQLAAAVHTFADYPEQWALLAERPDLGHAAVEEVMRHSPIVFNAIRQATEGVELGGVLIPAGSYVMASTAAANRDPARYDEPERLDITRDGPPAMLTFGGGVHYCLGAHLARVELSEALTVLARRMPNLRRTGPAPWKSIFEISGPTTLPVAFGQIVGEPSINP